MYFYNNNPILITQFICITISLLSILGVMIVFILGKGWKYFIVKLFATQIVCQLFFYIPQILWPFIYNTKCPDVPQYQNTGQRCLPSDWINKLQGYFVNSSFIAASIISLYSCQVIKECLTASKKNIQNKNRIYFIHTMAAVITFIVCIPVLLFAQYGYYGSTWKDEIIYYVANIEIQPDDIVTQILLIINLTINVIILIWSIVYHIQVKKLKSQIKDSLLHDVDNYSALNLYCIPLTLVFCWTINLIFKLFDYKCNYIRELNSITFSILFYIPQTFLPLQGFNYASIFFYAFHLQLVPNLPKSLRRTYIFFAKISYCNLIFGKIKYYDISQESIFYQNDSANLSTSSLIRKEESSTNR